MSVGAGAATRRIVMAAERAEVRTVTAFLVSTASSARALRSQSSLIAIAPTIKRPAPAEIASLVPMRKLTDNIVMDPCSERMFLTGASYG